MLYDLVKENRSYRGYKEGYTISEEDLKDLINMARITASGANLQPLKYRIVTDSSEVDALNSLTRWAKMLNKNLTLFTIKLTLKDTDKIIGIFFISKLFINRLGFVIFSIGVFMRFRSRRHRCLMYL